MIHRACRIGAATTALGALLSGLAGCEAKTASGTTGAPTPATAVTGAAAAGGARGAADAAPPVEADPGTVRVTGLAFRAAGLGTDPDEPYDRGMVALIPFAQFQQAQARLNLPGPLHRSLRESLAVPESLLQEAGVGAGNLGLDGTFNVGVRPGPHALCLIELGGRRPPDAAPGTRWIERWIQVDVTDEELQTILPVYNRETGEIAILR
jgi:hypothetical protein